MDHSSGSPSRLAFVFPGQGSQKAGMGRALLAEYPAAKARLAAFSEIVETDLVDLLCGNELRRDTLSVHLAMTSFGLVAWEWLTEIRGLRPQMLAGHSLGEITALACAGALSAEQALLLARERGRCLAEACERRPGSMAAFVGAPLAHMQATISAWIATKGLAGSLWIVNFNGPGQLVAAGEASSLQALCVAMQAEGLTAIPLATAGAFHTPFMAEAALSLVDCLRTLAFRAPRIPVVSSMSGRLLTQSQALATHLAFQVVKPVRWLDVMQGLRRAQIMRVIELAGGKGVLSPLIASCEDWQAETTTLDALLGQKAGVERRIEEWLPA